MLDLICSSYYYTKVRVNRAKLRNIWPLTQLLYLMLWEWEGADITYLITNHYYQMTTVLHLKLLSNVFLADLCTSPKHMPKTHLANKQSHCSHLLCENIVIINQTKGKNTPNLQDLDHSQQTIKQWKHPKIDHTVCSGLLLRATFSKQCSLSLSPATCITTKVGPIRIIMLLLLPSVKTLCSWRVW